MLFFPKNPNYHGPKYWGLSGNSLSRMIGFAAGSGFLLFGFDQGVLSGLLTLPSFTEVFPELDTTKGDGAAAGTSSESTWQGLTVGLYESEHYTRRDEPETECELTISTEQSDVSWVPCLAYGLETCSVEGQSFGSEPSS